MRRLLVRLLGSVAVAVIFGIVGWLIEEPAQFQPFEEES